MQGNYRSEGSESFEPIVDIVIPYYDGFDYLREAVESVKAQTFTAFRLLILDDATPGNQASNYIHSLNDTRITYLANPINLGLPGNFEKARTSIASKYGVILGQDDRLLPRYLERMILAADQHPGAALIQPKVQVIDAGGESTFPLPDKIKDVLRKLSTRFAKSISTDKDSPSTYLVESKLAISMIMLGDFLYFPTIMWRSEMLVRHPFRQDLPVTLDIDLIVNLLISEGDLLLVEEPLAQYRRHDQSRSEKPELKLSRLREESALYEELRTMLKARGYKIQAKWAKLRLSTRLYALHEMLLAILSKDFQETWDFLMLGTK